MKRILREMFLRFVLITLGLVLALVTLELGVRVLGLYEFPTDDFIQPHAELGWSHIPGKEGYWIIGNNRIHIKINSRGLRDKEYSYHKKEGTFRILVLGDSFTEGFQVPLDDTFCKVLEDKLNRGERQFEVINAGFAGVGTDYELLFFRHEGYKYSPDLVLLAFFPNDISDNFRSETILPDQGGLIEYEKKGLIVRVKHFLAETSCAYNYLGYTLPKHVPFIAKTLMKLGVLSPQPLDDSGGIDQLHYLVFAKRYGPEWERAWNVTKMLLAELRKEAEKTGADLAVVCIPFREQVYESIWKSRLSKPAMSEREWDLKKPCRMLEDFLTGRDVPFLELLTYFRKAGEKSELYHSPDGHWNVSGHHLAGQVIYNWLLKKKLVPVEAVKAPR